MSGGRERIGISDLWIRNAPTRQGLKLKLAFTDNRTEDRENKMKRIYEKSH